jgi:integrase
MAMIDKPVKLPFLKLDNSLPYYFDESDVLKILSVCNNLKHYCMLKVLFFGCLQSGELCKLDVSDYDPLYPNFEAESERMDRMVYDTAGV